MLESIQQLDIKLYFFLHHTCKNGVFDILMPFLRNKLTWIPLYMFILYLLSKYTRRKFVLYILGTLFLIAFSDILCAQVLKPFFHRIRPCNIFIYHPFFHNFNLCSSTYSFPSCHATNHAALAVFWMFVLDFKKPILVFLPLWAFVISFSQVYIGVHYPSDVIIGMVLGSFIGFLIFKITEVINKKL